MSRKTLSVDTETYDRLAACKREGESWNDCLFRLATDALDGSRGTGVEREQTMNTLTTAHIEDIVTQTAARTADEVENRLTGR